MTDKNGDYVALYTSAWIEIQETSPKPKTKAVALYTSAWIEILMPFWQRPSDPVALYTSAWIEIVKGSTVSFKDSGRTLYECVD